VETEGNRARRYPIQAYVEVASVPPEKQLRERTTDLSLFGCHVKTVTPFTPGTEVSIQIAHAGENFGARGRVAYARPNVGMGIVFTTIQSHDRTVLEEWIADLGAKQ
jgi:PilZ domain